MHRTITALLITAFLFSDASNNKAKANTINLQILGATMSSRCRQAHAVNAPSNDPYASDCTSSMYNYTEGVRGEIDTINGNIQSLQLKTWSVPEDILNNTNQINTNVESISELQDSLSQINANSNASTDIQNSLNDLQSSLSSQEEFSSRLSETVDNNRNSTEANRGKTFQNEWFINKNAGDITSNWENINKNKNAIADVETKATAARASTITNQGDIKLNTTSITGLETGVSSNLEKISANQQNIATNVANIATAREKADANSSNIQINASEISRNASSIDTNTSRIIENKSQIESNDDDIASLIDKIDNPNKVQVKDNGFSVGGANLIETNDGITSIGQNSIKFQEVDGVEQMWAEDKADNVIDINIAKGSDLLINGRSVQGQIDDNRSAINSNRNNINSLGEGVAASTALSSAMTALPTVSADSQLTCGVGTGTYSGATAVALGCASKINDRLSVNIGGSKVLQGSSSFEYGSGSLDSFAARAGLVMRLGKLHKPNATDEELQARLQQVEAENQEIQQQNKQLMARLERLEAIALGIQSNTDELAVVPAAVVK